MSTRTACCCGHGMAIEDINQAHELVRQLMVLLMPLLPPGGWSDVADHWFKEILKYSSSAVSRLQAADGGSEASDVVSGNEHIKHGTIRVDDKMIRKSYDGRDMLRGHKRSRRKMNSSSIVTTIPYQDGYEWRKYGQKVISDGRHPRSYFRCTFSREQGCPATKTVQQEDTDCYPPKFVVNYGIHHTCCRSNDDKLPLVMESAANEEASVRPSPIIINGSSMLPMSIPLPLPHMISIHHPSPSSCRSQDEYDMPAGDDHGTRNDQLNSEVHLAVAQATAAVDMADQRDWALNAVGSLDSVDLDMSWATILNTVGSAEVSQYY